MAVTTGIKTFINRMLKPVNLRLDSLTEQNQELARIRSLEELGQLDGPVYPLLEGCGKLDLMWIERAISRYSSELSLLMSGEHPGSFGFDPENRFFNGSDAVMLYLMVREFKPKRIIEVGSGNSTRIVRAALSDGGVVANHVAIDPFPREDIQGLVDQIHRRRLEEIKSSDLLDLVDSLHSGDVLFIDSSHEVRTGGDLAVIFCRVLPRLKPGVVVHFHDIFLPFEYPREFLETYPMWGEQYLVQTWMAQSAREVLWAGFFIQKSRNDLFIQLGLDIDRRAQSFWIRT